MPPLWALSLRCLQAYLSYHPWTMQGFTQAHGLAVNNVSGSTYIVEIEPNIIWNFVPVGKL